MFACARFRRETSRGGVVEEEEAAFWEKAWQVSVILCHCADYTEWLLAAGSRLGSGPIPPSVLTPVLVFFLAHDVWDGYITLLLLPDYSLPSSKCFSLYHMIYGVVI